MATTEINQSTCLLTYLLLLTEVRLLSESQLTNICRHTTYTTSSGHLVSPKFPDMYPNRRNCTCAVSAPPGSRVVIGTAFLLVKSNEPCRDWLSLTVDSAPEVKRCGFIPHSERVTGNAAIVNFRSDRREREMGFWLYFRGKQYDVDSRTNTMCAYFPVILTHYTHRGLPLFSRENIFQGLK